MDVDHLKGVVLKDVTEQIASARRTLEQLQHVPSLLRLDAVEWRHEIAQASLTDTLASRKIAIELLKRSHLRGNDAHIFFTAYDPRREEACSLRARFRNADPSSAQSDELVVTNSGDGADVCFTQNGFSLERAAIYFGIVQGRPVTQHDGTLVRKLVLKNELRHAVVLTPKAVAGKTGSSAPGSCPLQWKPNVLRILPDATGELTFGLKCDLLPGQHSFLINLECERKDVGGAAVLPVVVTAECEVMRLTAHSIDFQAQAHDATSHCFDLGVIYKDTGPVSRRFRLDNESQFPVEVAFSIETSGGAVPSSCPMQIKPSKASLKPKGKGKSASKEFELVLNTQMAWRQWLLEGDLIGGVLKVAMQGSLSSKYSELDIMLSGSVQAKRFALLPARYDETLNSFVAPITMKEILENMSFFESRSNFFPPEGSFQMPPVEPGQTTNVAMYAMNAGVAPLKVQMQSKVHGVSFTPAVIDLNGFEMREVLLTYAAPDNPPANGFREDRSVYDSHSYRPRKVSVPRCQNLELQFTCEASAPGAQLGASEPEAFWAKADFGDININGRRTESQLVLKVPLHLDEGRDGMVHADGTVEPCEPFTILFQNTGSLPGMLTLPTQNDVYARWADEPTEGDTRLERILPVSKMPGSNDNGRTLSIQVTPQDLWATEGVIKIVTNSKNKPVIEINYSVQHVKPGFAFRQKKSKKKNSDKPRSLSVAIVDAPGGGKMNRSLLFQVGNNI